MPTLGIDSIGSIFTDFGYTKMDMLSFPGKKLTAYWYAPPKGQTHLPRVFISELRVGPKVHGMPARSASLKDPEGSV